MPFLSQLSLPWWAHASPAYRPLPRPEIVKRISPSKLWNISTIVSPVHNLASRSPHLPWGGSAKRRCHASRPHLCRVASAFCGPGHAYRGRDVVAFASITFLHIVLGELAPKSLALLHPEHVSCWVAPPLLWFTSVFWPAIWLLNKSAAGFLSLFAIRPPAHAERVHAPEELLLLFSESRKHGLVEDPMRR